MVLQCIFISLCLIASNFDEKKSLQYNFDFQDLKNLKKQLYSAADYFELSYCDDNQRPL